MAAADLAPLDTSQRHLLTLRGTKCYRKFYFRFHAARRAPFLADQSETAPPCALLSEAVGLPLIRHWQVQAADLAWQLPPKRLIQLHNLGWGGHTPIAHQKGEWRVEYNKKCGRWTEGPHLPAVDEDALKVGTWGGSAKHFPIRMQCRIELPCLPWDALECGCSAEGSTRPVGLLPYRNLWPSCDAVKPAEPTIHSSRLHATVAAASLRCAALAPVCILNTYIA